uniref:RRM domain-containing protein n=1 Tax=Malurus cyaneus samueli TaxID=2593467 RepID=A0A8C5X4Z7_9PASS
MAPVGPSWLLTAPFGSAWHPLAPVGSSDGPSWLLMAPVGSTSTTWHSNDDDVYRAPPIDRSILPTKRLPKSPPYTAFLGNLPYDVTEESIKDFFRGLNVSDVPEGGMNTEREPGMGTRDGNLEWELGIEEPGMEPEMGHRTKSGMGTGMGTQQSWDGKQNGNCDGIRMEPGMEQRKKPGIENEMGTGMGAQKGSLG